MRRLLFAIILLVSTGCTTLGFQPQVGVVTTGAETVMRSTQEIRDAVPAKPDADCDREARAFYFVTHLPAIQEVYQFDLYLSRKNPNPSEPKYIGRCVLNPFSPQNVAEQGAE